jgi:MraZ protein
MKPYQYILLALGLLAGASVWLQAGTRRARPLPEPSPTPLASADSLPPSGLPAGFQVTEEPPLASGPVLRVVQARVATPSSNIAPARLDIPPVAVELPAVKPAGGSEAVTPLPASRPKATPARGKIPSPLNGTFVAAVSGGSIMLPSGVMEQIGGPGQKLLVSPGPDTCLWITNQAHLDRLSERLESSPARETDIRAFRRLYFAQVERSQPGPDGKLAVSGRLLEFAGLSGDCVLVGIDDHFEAWDAVRWREYARRPAGQETDEQP